MIWKSSKAWNPCWKAKHIRLLLTNSVGVIGQHQKQPTESKTITMPFVIGHLIDFVNLELFPIWRKFKSDDTSAFTIQYKIGEIFSELRNRIISGYNLREILWMVDELHFQTSKEKHELSHLYESRINRMGNAGRNGGEYYTPRPLIRTIVKAVNPNWRNHLRPCLW